jgi:hypothetical protein
MSGFCRTAESKPARKEHRCQACHWQIAIGEHYMEQTGVWDGKAFRNRFHDECFYALSDDGDDEFTPGSFDPPDRLKCKECAGAGRVNRAVMVDNSGRPDHITECCDACEGTGKGL